MFTVPYSISNIGLSSISISSAAKNPVAYQSYYFIFFEIFKIRINKMCL